MVVYVGYKIILKNINLPSQNKQKILKCIDADT